ncbi:MAG: response regulator [Bdellovibrionales bacterium]|nr:response regulator [Bdellovibrionales bacterium]
MKIQLNCEKISIRDNRLKKSVLVIDDNYFSRFIAAKIIEANGCNVKTVKSGSEALITLIQQPVDLIVLDWSMPKYDGGDTLMFLDRLMKKLMISLPYVIYTGLDPQLIELPYTKRLHLIDFWHKNDELFSWHKSAKNLVQRLQRRKL